MNDSINLLIKNKEEDLRTKRLASTLRAISFVLLFGISASSVILYIMMALTPLPALKKTEAAAHDDISYYHPDMAQLSLLNSRLDEITKILATRQNSAQTVQLLSDQLPSGITVKSLQIDQKSITLTVISSSLDSLDTFMNTMKAYQETKKVFAHMSLDSLAFQPDRGQYVLSMGFKLL